MPRGGCHSGKMLCVQIWGSSSDGSAKHEAAGGGEKNSNNALVAEIVRPADLGKLKATMPYFAEDTGGPQGQNVI